MNRLAAAAIVLWLAVPLDLHAHPLAATDVTLTFAPDRTFDIAITIDAESLRLKEAALGPAIDLIDLRFDGQRAALSVAARPSDGDAAPTFRLRGETPRGARAFTWKSALVYGSYPLIVKNRDDAAPSVEWLNATDTSVAHLIGSGDAFAWMRQALDHVRLGFTHIVPHGLDHILFVLGLFLLTRRAKAILLQVSAFTIAHSITLGLSLYGVVSLPSRFVEPLIALSIAYVAVENLFTSDVKAWRVALVFAFGLLHGLGFAEALSSLHLPRAQFLSALISFNAGVELGQLTVVAAAAIVFASLRRSGIASHERLAAPSSAVIAAAGVYWTVSRLLP